MVHCSNFSIVTAIFFLCLNFSFYGMSKKKRKNKAQLLLKVVCNGLIAVFPLSFVFP